MKIGRLSIGYVTVIVLLIIHLLPVWGFKYFPTQDGASHIYNSYVLKEYHKHENYRLREVYELNTTLFPNWTSHILLAALLYIFPPLICEKIVLTLCIGLLPLSLLYFLNGVEKRNTVFGLLGFLFAYNYLLHMGFYNFVLSMSLFFFALGYWWRVKDKLRLTHVIVLYVLLLATYFTHYHSYALLIVSLTFFALYTPADSLLQEVFGHKEPSQPLMHRFRASAMKLKSTLIFLVGLIPAYFILFSYYFYLSNTHGSGGDHKGFEWLNDYFFGMKSLVSFRDDHVLIGRVLLVFFATAFVLTVINRIQQCHQFRESEEWKETGERLWTRAVSQMDGFLLMAVLITIMYFVAPWSGYSGGWINDRFHLYIFLVLLPFFAVNLHRYANYAVAGVIIVLSLWHLGYNVHTYTLLNRDIANALSLEGMDEKDTILMSTPGEWGGFSDSLGFEPKYVEPFGHIECLLATHKGIGYLNNYEANTDHFPLQYKRKELPADYAIIWRTEYDDVAGLEEEYELIDSNDYNRLYRRKRAAPDSQMWDGKTTITFDMQPEDGQTVPDYIAAYTDTVYTDGRYGWLTESEREDFKNESEVSQPYEDSIWAMEDGVFRVALPNGTYKVTCYFSANDSEPLEVNLIAGREHQIQRLRIPTGNETIEKHYTITITDEHLTQVIYTRGKGEHKRWGWSGFTIQSTDGGPNFRLP
ncbi:hypothetical protein F4054_09000 [Candidatus Poribacteria bacterium]|nr:hypothetical protein [Candidatus Poribacteria bacterium]MYG07004.1 hypothetical protein [Candidatus Poribacteria bacterium]MYK22385.1 hypothetical protein [Candidatus Poribacteria bacterium]